MEGWTDFYRVGNDTLTAVSIRMILGPIVILCVSMFVIKHILILEIYLHAVETKHTLRQKASHRVKQNVSGAKIKI